MTTRTTRNRTIALAGLFQAARLVHDIARKGMADNDPFTASIGSVLRIDAQSVEAVYGSLGGVRLGLRQIQKQIQDRRDQTDVEVARYAVSVLYLERKLCRRNDLLGKIHDGVQHATEQADLFGATHGNVLASLADLYSRTVSTVRPRIVVNGEHLHLANEDNANRIRSLLLAAIRSAVLWRQCGGKRWHLVFGQKALARDAARLLASLEVAVD